MINAMDCELFNEQLMPYLEHETDDVTRAAIERHAVTCGDCGALLADLRKLRLEAANLPVLSPSRDLWSGIASRIETPVVSIGGDRDARVRRNWISRMPARQALVAASLVAAIGIGYLIPRPGTAVADRDPETPDVARRIDTVLVPAPATGESSATVASVDVVNAAASPRQAVPTTTPGASVAAVPPTAEVQAVLASLTADYDREIARLRTLLDSNRTLMDPATLVVIERNIAVIDTAIAQSKQAVARDPNSRFLIESLNQSLQTKVNVMRTAAMLPSGT